MNVDMHSFELLLTRDEARGLLNYLDASFDGPMDGSPESSSVPARELADLLREALAEPSATES